MCKFFSLVSDGHGTIFYLDAQQRQKTKSKYESPDSHTSIADYYGIREDRVNKYEFNPLTRILNLDQINNNDDSILVKGQCLTLDFTTIMPILIVKHIINPFTDIQYETVTKEDITLLQTWRNVRDSIAPSAITSISNSIRTSLLTSAGDSWDNVWGEVWASINPIMTSVRISVKDSWGKVWDGKSIRKSVQDSIWVYLSTFFRIDYRFDFSSCAKLWERGLVPSFDGKIWRLHGTGGKIIWEENK